MRDLLPQIEAWLADGRQVALATVIRTWGSSPRPAGAQMAVSQEGEIAGSVSGGCVEGAVTAAALEVLAGGEPRQLHFGVSDDTAWSVGLACGGEIDVFVQRFDPAWLPLLRAALQQSIRFALLINLTSGEWQLWQEGDRGAPPPPESGEHTLAGERVFVNWVAPPPKLIVVGGVHIAIPLVTMAKAAGFYTVVIDPRRAFGRSERFPQADEVLTSWPRQAMAQTGITAATAVATLTHDPKIDDPALEVALRSPAFYVGALGSRKTHAARLERLRATGLTAEQLRRIHAPIGLDLGGRAPEEIALAILAEIVQERHLGSRGSTSRRS